MNILNVRNILLFLQTKDVSHLLSTCKEYANIITNSFWYNYTLNRYHFDILKFGYTINIEPLSIHITLETTRYEWFDNHTEAENIYYLNWLAIYHYNKYHIDHMLGMMYPIGIRFWIEDLYFCIQNMNYMKQQRCIYEYIFLYIDYYGNDWCKKDRKELSNKRMCRLIEKMKLLYKVYSMSMISDRQTIYQFIKDNQLKGKMLEYSQSIFNKVTGHYSIRNDEINMTNEIMKSIKQPHLYLK